MPRPNKFKWDDEKERTLLRCWEKLEGSHHGNELHSQLSQAFKSQYPECTLAVASLTTELHKIRKKSRPPTFPPISSPIPPPSYAFVGPKDIFAWDADKIEYLQECYGLALKPHNEYLDVKEFARLFKLEYPDCKLNKKSLLTYYHQAEVDATLPTGKRGKVQLLWSPGADAHLAACVLEAELKRGTDHVLGYRHWKTGSRGRFQFHLHNLFREKFPRFELKQVRMKANPTILQSL